LLSLLTVILPQLLDGALLEGSCSRGCSRSFGISWWVPRSFWPQRFRSLGADRIRSLLLLIAILPQLLDW